MDGNSPSVEQSVASCSAILSMAAVLCGEQAGHMLGGMSRVNTLLS